MHDLSYAPPLLVSPAELAVSAWSPQSLGTALQYMQQHPASGAPVAANLVVYVPFFLPEAATLTGFFWSNGGGVAGNLDAGLYLPTGELLSSTGTTAQSGTNRPQNIDVTDLPLSRGDYYMALVCSTVTTQLVARVVPAAGILQSLGLLQQDISGTGLPLATNASPATFAKWTTAWLPVFGVRFNCGLGL